MNIPNSPDKNQLRKEIFPEKREYKAHRYRIDGDSVLIVNSKGKEIQFSFPYSMSPEAVSNMRAEVARGGSKSLPLAAYRPSTFMQDMALSNSVPTHHGTQKVFGISNDEFFLLQDIAGEILAAYWRSIATSSQI